MTKKVKCQTKTRSNIEQVRVKIIKAPLVDSRELRNIIMARAKALIL